MLSMSFNREIHAQQLLPNLETLHFPHFTGRQSLLLITFINTNTLNSWNPAVGTSCSYLDIGILLFLTD
jgi:hypothetical protein